jgi:hypothetical protein
MIVPQPGPQSGHISTVDFSWSFEDLPFSEKSRYFISSRIRNSILLALQNAKLRPEVEGVHVCIESLELDPQMQGSESIEDVGRLTSVLAVLLGGTATAMWGAIAANYVQSKYVELPHPEFEWFLIRPEGDSRIWSDDTLGCGFPTEPAAREALTKDLADRGYQIVRARDEIAASSLVRGIDDSTELRHGRPAMTHEEAVQVRPWDEIYHIGREAVTHVQMVLEGQGGPYFRTRHGVEVYSLFLSRAVTE